MSNSSRPHELQPTRLLCPWDSPGKSTGVGCHCLLQTPCLNIFKTHQFFFFLLFLPLSYPSVQFSSVAPSCPTLCHPMNHSTPGLPVHHQLPEFTQTHIHRVGDAIQPRLVSRNFKKQSITKPKPLREELCE